jgi:hypothetical protein
MDRADARSDARELRGSAWRSSPTRRRFPVGERVESGWDGGPQGRTRGWARGERPCVSRVGPLSVAPPPPGSRPPRGGARCAYFWLAAFLGRPAGRLRTPTGAGGAAGTPDPMGTPTAIGSTGWPTATGAMGWPTAIGSIG